MPIRTLLIALCVGLVDAQDTAIAAEPRLGDAIPLMRSLADFVHEHHVVRDPQRATFGMTYEFWRGGKQIQDFGLDSLHDGAWLIAALLSADRADPPGKRLDRALQFQIPFYVNLLEHSDRLFPLIKKTDEDKAPLAKPFPGRIPLAWDDGGGFDLNTGRRHEPRYNTHQGPNHLAQDVADALLSAWLTTRDPRVAEALKLLHQERLANFGRVGPIAFAAGIAGGDAKLADSVKLPVFQPTAMPGYSGLYQQNAEPLAAYDDPLGWQYGQAVALAVHHGKMDEAFVAFAAAKAHGYATTMELFYDDRPWRPGLHFFDIQRQPRLVAKQGRLDEYASKAKKLMGGRGIQIAWVAAAVLPDLRRRPEIWEAYYRQHHKDEPLARIVDKSPTIDGERDALFGESPTVANDKLSLWFLADTKHLYVFAESAGDVDFSIRHTGPVNGEAIAGRFAVRKGGKPKVESSIGEPLVHDVAFGKGDGLLAEFRVPFTVVPGQKQWINGVDHGRYTVRFVDGNERVIYLLSSPERIIARLERYVDGTIGTWNAVWKELGVIPSGYRGTNLANKHWELSDAGNYAHLIRLIALRTIDRQGKREWELLRDEKRTEKKVSPLPDSVLRAQGLC